MTQKQADEILKKLKKHKWLKDFTKTELSGDFFRAYYYHLGVSECIGLVETFAKTDLLFSIIPDEGKLFISFFSYK